MQARFVPDLFVDTDRKFTTPTDDPELLYVLRRADLYAQLLVSRQYDSVQLDVLAGASAGGLNAVLYGVAQRAGVAVDGLMDVWADSGSAWNLLERRPVATLASILRADYFWDQVTTAIETFYSRQGTTEHVTPEVTVDLSATITDTEYKTMPGSKDPHGHFHFLGTDVPPAENAIATAGVTGFGDPTGRDIPSSAQVAEREQSESEISIRRLAYSARTTSSFPGAFEQARIWSSTTAADGTLATVKDLPGQQPPVDMTFAFSTHRKQTSVTAMPIRVMDGGVLDNIPIDRLTRAVRDRTPRQHSDRIAVYLDPSPDDLPVAQLRPEKSDPPRPGEYRDDRGKQSFLATVANGLFMRGIRESENDETDQLEDLLATSLVARNRAIAYADLLAQRAPDETDAAALSFGYATYRAETDALLVQRSLSNPDLWQLTTDLPTRSWWESIDPAQSRRLNEAFIAAYDPSVAAVTTLATIASGSQALRDASLCALDWMRAIEQRAFGSDRAGVIADADLRADLRRDIHRAAITARQLRDRHIRTLLNVSRPSDGNLPPFDPATVVALWLTIESQVEPERAALWATLRNLRTRLQTRWNKVAELQGHPVIWAFFPESWGVESFAPFATPSGVPDPFDLEQYGKITAAQESGLDSDFGPLVVAQRASVVERWLSLPRGRFGQEAKQRNLPQRLDPGAKLAGSTLGNFGAFFSRAWRNNDWWWGRLDASAGIVDTLALLPASSPVSTGPLRNAAQRLALLQMNVSGDKRRPYPEGVAVPAPPSGATSRLTEPEIAAAATIAARHSAGAHTLAQLRPSYLVSVASRASRLAVRAVRSGQSVPVWIATTLLLPPILIFAPLAFATVRVGFVVTALFALLRFVGDPTATSELHASWGEWILTALAALLVVLGTWSTARIWLRILRLRARSDQLRSVLGARAVRAFLKSLLLLAISGTALGFAIHHDCKGLPVDAVLVYLCLAAAVCSLAASKVAGRLEGASFLASTVVWTILTGLAAFVLFDPQWWIDRVSALPAGLLHAASWLHVPVHEAGLAAAVVFATLTWGWIGGITVDWKRILGLVAWAILSVVVGVAGIGAATFVLWLVATSHGHALVAEPPGFGAGLAAGLAVWFVAGHVGWWLSDVLPTWWLKDIDDPKFARVH
ncbi:MAG: DUF3376 domain-containing protein [Pseudolysinimonas sp.]